MPMVKAMIHSDLPELKSERRFARILKDLDFPSDNQPHVWFVKPPGLKDVDAVGNEKLALELHPAHFTPAVRH
jgi:hypothetical protein